MNQGTKHQHFTYAVALILSLLCYTNTDPKVYHLIVPGPSELCCATENCSTLSQFANISSNSLANDTVLRFLSGNYHLQVDLTIMNVYSFSMVVEPGSTTSITTKAKIICERHVKIAFLNVSDVVVSGFEFVGCIGNEVASVGQFQLESSIFHSQADANGTSLIITETMAFLDRVTFVINTISGLVEKHDNDKAETIIRALSLSKSAATITQCCFEGYHFITGEPGTAVHGKHGSNIIIFNTTFVRNSAIMHHHCFHNNIIYGIQCSVATILYAESESTMEICYSVFAQNRGVLITAFGDLAINITYSEFIGNIAYAGVAMIHVTDHAKLTISHSSFTNTHDRFWTSGVVLYLNGTMACIAHSKFMRITTSQIISASNANLSIVHSDFIGNTGPTRIINAFNASLSIVHSDFSNNTGPTRIINAFNANLSIFHSDFNDNKGPTKIINAFNANLSIFHSDFSDNKGPIKIINAFNANLSIVHSDFSDNTGLTIIIAQLVNMVVIYGKFINNTQTAIAAIRSAQNITIINCEFINNRVQLGLINNMNNSGGLISVRHCTFIKNSGYTTSYYYGLIVVEYSANTVIASNDYTDNDAIYDVYISPLCQEGYSLSLGSSHCIQCSQNWYLTLIGTVTLALVAGICLIIFVFALNMTTAVGTINGILFYANIVAVNSDTYFLPFTTPSFVGVFISWLNLDFGFDICFFEGMDTSDKALVQLAFPTYIIVIVIFVIIFSECSKKFAKVIGQRNPIAVLATLILISYTKFFTAIVGSLSLLYAKPTFGSSISQGYKLGDVQILKKNYFLLIISPLIFLLGAIYTILIFSWQWLLRCQHKHIFKWVRYQKLHHFIDPYHAPYTSMYRYWTGLLLLVRIALLLQSALNFSIDPKIDLVMTVIAVSCLLVLKAIVAKRIYKSWPLDVIETIIYFNLIIFACLTLYNLETNHGNQIAVAYTSVSITFFLLISIIFFHAWRYTRLYKILETCFKRMSSKFSGKQNKRETSAHVPEEMAGYQQERAQVQEPPIVTHTVVEMCEPLL